MVRCFGASDLGHAHSKIEASEVLEIGSFEGASTCYLIDHADGEMELHCIDTWEGAAEHKLQEVDMSAVEGRFHKNTSAAANRCSYPVKVVVHKGRSDTELAKLIAEGHRSYFDMIYVDGSHFAHDVLSDAILSFPLLKVGGHMFFDDYLWRATFSATDPTSGPKIEIDAFLNVFYHKMRLVYSPNSQVVAEKTADSDYHNQNNPLSL